MQYPFSEKCVTQFFQFDASFLFLVELEEEQYLTQSPQRTVVEMIHFNQEILTPFQLTPLADYFPQLRLTFGDHSMPYFGGRK